MESGRVGRPRQGPTFANASVWRTGPIECGRVVSIHVSDGFYVVLDYRAFTRQFPRARRALARSKRIQIGISDHHQMPGNGDGRPGARSRPNSGPGPPARRSSGLSSFSSLRHRYLVTPSLRLKINSVAKDGLTNKDSM